MSTNTDGRAPTATADAPPQLQELDPHAALPPLHGSGAWPTVRDRWERLTTTGFVPAPLEAVRAALTDPAAVAQWLAVCRGALDDIGGETILDFEDGEFFLCRTTAAGETADGAYEVQYVWRWLGIGPPATVTRSSTEIDNHDAPLGSVLVLVPPSPVVPLPLIVFLALAPVLDSVVVRRHVQLRAVLLAPLLFFPASDLFDDPGLEHGTPSLTSCNIPAP